MDYEHDRDAIEVGLDPKLATFQYLYRSGRDHVVEFWSHGRVGKYQNDIDRFIAGNRPAFYMK